MTAEIRAFAQADRDEVLRIFRLNTPTFFAPEEVAELERYLDKHAATYFVVVEDHKVVGCGGYHVQAGIGRLSWDFFDPAHRGKGFGKRLIEHCLAKLKERKDVQTTAVWTSQLAFGFYEKFGFRIVEIRPDHWGPGLHLYRMEIPG